MYTRKVEGKNYILYLGDFTIMSEVVSDVADLAITDPPYKLTSGGVSGQMRHGIFDPSIYDNKGELFNTVQPLAWMEMAYKTIRQSGDFYIMTNDKNMKELLDIAVQFNLRLHNILVWDKLIQQTPNRWYMKRCEFILYLWKGTARPINNMGESNIIQIKPKMGNRFHPTEKPVSLTDVFVRNSSREGDTIIDMFMGSGSTGISSILNKRKFIGIEKSETYFNVAAQRLEYVERHGVDLQNPNGNMRIFP